MEHKRTSIDLVTLVENLKRLRENTTFLESQEILRLLMDANEKGRFDDYLDQAEMQYYSEGVDLVTAFHYAYYDVLVDPKEK